jgi:hypothetical protein
VKNIKHLRTGNLYSINDREDLQLQLSRALVHYARKHGLQPAVIVVNPQTLKGLEGDLEIESRDNGDVYRAVIVAENSVSVKTVLITDGEA